MLRGTLPRVLALAPEMVAQACQAAGVDPAGPLAGAAWLSGPAALVASIRTFAEALDDIAVSGRPALPAAHLRERIEGRLVARLTPRSYAERSLHRDAEVSAVFAEGVEVENVIAGQAAFYRRGDSAGGVAQVTDDGGPLSAAPIRALTALFAEGKIAVLSPSPERAWLGPLLERALAPLVETGFLRLASPANVGAPPSARPHYPVIILPAYYALDELSFVARRIASEIFAGAAFDLPAPRLLVVGDHWAQQALFLDHLQRALAALPSSVPIVAGADVPAGALGVVSAGGDDPVEVLGAAVDLCDGRHGTAAEIVAHVVQEEDPEIGAALRHAAARLPHRLVGINQWPAVLAFRGEASWDGQGGSRMLPSVDKLIVRGPLRTRRLPAYFHDVRHSARLGADLCAFQAAPSVGALVRGVRG